MQRALVALLLLALPACAEDLDLSGTWTGTITQVGTRLQSTYSPITGVTVTPVPDVQTLPSPFGPIVLATDGTYAMPDLDISGDWALDGETLTLTGGLSDAPARVEVLEGGPVLVIDFDIGEGQVQSVTFSRMP